MKSYSQNKEDLFVLNHFGKYKGTLLEIGANDGVTLSNSKLLIENGWKSHLVEPGIINEKLFAMYNNNENVTIHNFAIGNTYGRVKFWESGCHVPNGNDSGLVSAMDYSETKRWPNVEFIEREINVAPFSILEEYSPFDFISIDAEGMDWHILKQIDLQAIGCRCLCIEWNSDLELLKLFTEYCKGFKLVVKNAENLIFCL